MKILQLRLYTTISCFIDRNLTNSSIRCIDINNSGRKIFEWPTKSIKYLTKTLKIIKLTTSNCVPTNSESVKSSSSNGIRRFARIVSRYVNNLIENVVQIMPTHFLLTGFANKPFRSDFRIPKAQSYGQNHYQRAPPLFPPPPPPPMTFQSPMASLEDNYEDYQDVHPPRNFQPRNNNWGPPRGNRRPPAFRPSAPTFDDGGSQMDSGPFKRKAFNFCKL